MATAFGIDLAGPWVAAALGYASGIALGVSGLLLWPYAVAAGASAWRTVLRVGGAARAVVIRDARRAEAAPVALSADVVALIEAAVGRAVRESAAPAQAAAPAPVAPAPPPPPVVGG